MASSTEASKPKENPPGYSRQMFQPRVGRCVKIFRCQSVVRQDDFGLRSAREELHDDKGLPVSHVLDDSSGGQLFCATPGERDPFKRPHFAKFSANIVDIPGIRRVADMEPATRVTVETEMFGLIPRRAAEPLRNLSRFSPCVEEALGRRVEQSPNSEGSDQREFSVAWPFFSYSAVENSRAQWAPK